MRFHLHHRRFDPRGLIERHQIFQHHVGQSNRPALASINELFHRAPRLQQRDAVIINDVTRMIARFVVVSRLKREGTDSLKLLAALAGGAVYYDPGIKLEHASTKPEVKRRSQFRVASKNISALYESVEVVEV
jgi:hypothetical protein